MQSSIQPLEQDEKTGGAPDDTPPVLSRLV